MTKTNTKVYFRYRSLFKKVVVEHFNTIKKDVTQQTVMIMKLEKNVSQGSNQIIKIHAEKVTGNIVPLNSKTDRARFQEVAIF